MNISDSIKIIDEDIECYKEFDYMQQEVGAWEIIKKHITTLEGIIAQHDLCHDLHGKVGPREFADSCSNEQRKLYGCAPDADELAKLKSKYKTAIEALGKMMNFVEKDVVPFGITVELAERALRESENT